MKKLQAIQYLALDVHQATIVATLRDATGSIRMRATVPTRPREILDLLRAAGARVHVIFEEGAQAQWMHDLLEPHVERVVVFNPRGREVRGNKSDRIDADRLSELLRTGSPKTSYHGSRSMLTLKELVQNYNNIVEDSTRVMLRIKALFRARAIPTPGTSVYRASRRQEWLALLDQPGVRLRAQSLYAELDVLQQLRPKAKAAMIAEARRQPAWKILREIPFFGPIRIPQMLAIMVTPYRFRTKRALWPYAGLAVVTHSSADQEFVNGQLRRRRRAPMTRGLNGNHNPRLKAIFKGAANAAAVKSGPLKDFYDACVARGVREELAKVTLARKLASVVLRLWKKGERWDPSKLTMQAI